MALRTLEQLQGRIEKVILLKEVPFFEGMTLDQLRILASISDITAKKQADDAIRAALR